jgi:hypothetical protein
MHRDTRQSCYDRPISDLTAQFGTDVQQGLTLPEAAQRLRQYGPNSCAKPRSSPRSRS